MTYYIGQNEDPPDESTGTRPDESTTFDPAAFQPNLPVGTGGTYFILPYFAGSYFITNYFPGDAATVGVPIPLLYPPYRAYFTNGKPYVRLTLTDGYGIIDAFLTDTPWSGITNIDLTDATVAFSLRNVLSNTPVFSNPALIVSPQILTTTGIPGTSIDLLNITALN